MVSEGLGQSFTRTSQRMPAKYEWDQVHWARGSAAVPLLVQLAVRGLWWRVVPSWEESS